MKYLTALLIFFGLTLYHSTQAQTLHFIIATDTQHPDTATAASCRADSAKMQKEALEMRNGSGYPLKLYFITGPDYNAENLKAKIKTVSAAPGDIVWVYISGNAACSKNEKDSTQMKNRWLAPGKSPDKKVSTDELLAEIEAKNARLNVMIVNTCALIRNIPSIAGNRGDAERKIYRSLLSARGTVRIFSSECSEYSYADVKGGLFTNVFLEILDHYIASGRQSLSWKELEHDVCPTTNQRCRSRIFRPQHPQFFYTNGFIDNRP